VFGGEFFYPEPDPMWRFERAAVTPYIYPGRWEDWDGTPLYKNKHERFGASRHMTNVFNVFVWLQIFNMLNARKIDGTYNIFDGIFTNPMYAIVMVCICGLQVIMIQLFQNVM
jgi:magnesium-transporting ATPase (P-type)